MDCNNNDAAEQDPLTYRIIGEAMRVHNELGPGLDEVFYHELLARRLEGGGLRCKSRERGSLLHRGKTADEFECDLLVSGETVLELKVLAAEEPFAPEHLTQILCYLKFWSVARGLLLDFGKERLIQRRVIFTERDIVVPDADTLAAQAPDFVTNRALALQTLRGLTNVLKCHGLGYRDTTYRGLVAADLAADGIAFSAQPTAVIRSSDGLLGEARCRCGVVAGETVLLVLALRNRISTTDRAILQTCLRHLGLPWGLVVNFGKTQFETLFVVAPRRNSGSGSLPSSRLRSSPNLRGA